VTGGMSGRRQRRAIAVRPRAFPAGPVLAYGTRHERCTDNNDCHLSRRASCPFRYRGGCRDARVLPGGTQHGADHRAGTDGRLHEHHADGNHHLDRAPDRRGTYRGRGTSTT
jgi:hypothetical protein